MSEYLSKEDIKKRRGYFLNKAEKVTKIKKGDKRVHGSRICTICGASLSNVVTTTGGTIATKNHFHCHFSELFYVDICMDSRSCYSNIKKLERGHS